MTAEGSVPTALDMQDDFREHELVECLKASFISPAVESGFRFPEKEKNALVELISIARSAEGRAKLAELKIVHSLVILLQQFPLQVGRRCQSNLSSSSEEELLGNLALLLKLARNLCAGDSTNQNALLECGGVGVLADIAGELLYSVRSREARTSEDLDDPPNVDTTDRDSTLEQIMATFESNSIPSSRNPKLVSPPVGCLQLMVQLLGNFAQRGEAFQAAVWERFFPFLLLRSAALRVEGIRGPLCMVIYICCKSSSKRCWELCQGFGSALLALVIVASMDITPDDAPGNKASSSPEQIEWLELLLQQLCFREPLFPLLFVNLGVPPLKRVIEHTNANKDDVFSVCRLCLESSSFTSVQASLLYILCDCLSYQTSNKDDSEGLPMPSTTLCILVDIVQMAAQGAVKDAEISPVPTLTSASCTVQILGFVLSTWRMLFSWDSTHGDRTQLTTLLLSYGFVELLLGLLTALGPPEVPGKGDTVGVALEDGLTNGGGKFPGKNPYLGYRRDIVAVIANFSHENPLFQDRVRVNGGLLLVLQNCVVERENPFLREWGLWAMRNLLEGNEQNQAEISQLEVKESVNLPELRRMGLNVQIDPNTRRPRLVNESASGLHL